MLLKTETERNKLKAITEKALRLYSTNYFNRTILVINIFSAPVLVVEGNAQQLFLFNVIPLRNTHLKIFVRFSLAVPRGRSEQFKKMFLFRN